MSDDRSDLPLFTGDHIAAIRFQRALDRLDLAAAAIDAPLEWHEAVAELRDALGACTAAGADLAALCRARREGWPAAVERTWQRLVGRHLDGRGVPGVLEGELAAAFLLRGGERERAERSLRRHLSYHPRDVRGWQLLAEFKPVRAAARCAFHRGPVLEAAWELVDRIAEDELSPPEDWLLSYAWFARAVDLDEVAAALAAENLLAVPPMPLPGDGRAFARFLLEAGGRRFGPDSLGVIAARERLQRISPAAFRRYLDRTAGAGARR